MFTGELLRIYSWSLLLYRCGDGWLFNRAPPTCLHAVDHVLLPAWAFARLYCSCAILALFVRMYRRPSQEAKRVELEARLAALEEERARTEALFNLRRDQFQLLMHSIIDFQRTVDEEG